MSATNRTNERQRSFYAIRVRSIAVKRCKACPESILSRALNRFWRMDWLRREKWNWRTCFSGENRTRAFFLESCKQNCSFARDSGRTFGNCTNISTQEIHRNKSPVLSILNKRLSSIFRVSSSLSLWFIALKGAIEVENSLSAALHLRLTHCDWWNGIKSRG